MAPTRVILMSCGSYNPPTDMHLRMFELARDHLHRMGTHIVVGAVISPTHDDYAKKDLASAEHRCAMLKLATQNSDWIRISTWETRQNGWTKTRLSLQHHQNLLNSLLLDTNDVRRCVDIADMDWIPEKLKNTTNVDPIQIKLLCGADLLESFGTPGLWAEEDIDAIVGQHGLVVITREGSNPHKFIYESDILSRYMHNIHIVINWIRHEVSSTKIRKAFRRGDSVKYEVQDSVIDYVHKHGLYGSKTVSTIKLELSSNNGNDYLNIQPKYQNVFLTPSPSDITMTTPSPNEMISIDISESVIHMNLQNSSNVDETERMREKFNNVIADNVNKQLASNKVAYPGQAKQIIATETGESQIFCEVGSSCTSENSKTEMDIDGMSEEAIGDDIALDVPCKIDFRVDVVEVSETIGISNDPSPSETLEILRSSDLTISPDDSDGKVSIVLAMDSIDANDATEALTKTVQHSTTLCAKEQNENVDPANYSKLQLNDDDTEGEHRGSIRLKPSTSRCNDFPISDLPEDRETKESECIAEANKSQEQMDLIDENVLAKIDELSVESGEHSVRCQHDDENVLRSHSEVFEDVSQSTIINESPMEITGDDKDPNDPTNRSKSSDNESTGDNERSKRDGNVEIDGKYLKSLVNSRKSPKKVKMNEDQDQTLAASSSSVSNTDETAVEPGRSKIDGNSDESPIDALPSTRDLRIVKDAILAKSTTSTSVKSNGRKRGVLFQGSLDSINVAQTKSPSIVNRHQPITKKSKSYEFIKPTDIQRTTIYKIPSVDLKSDADSTSVFVTANDAKDPQTDEFCSVCCYANDPSSTEVFFTLRSNASSPLDEDSTECDLCSNCDLRENGETADFNNATTVAPGDPVCELCEICGDRGLDEDVVASSRPEKDDFVDRRLLASRPLPLSLPKNTKPVGRIDKNDDDDDDDDDDDVVTENRTIRKKIIENRDNVDPNRSKSIDEQSPDNTNSNDDQFEIENCGLDIDVDFQKNNETVSRYKAEVEDTFRNLVPRDEVAMSGKSVNKMMRAGSLVSRDTVDRSKGKRRYSSVDNLQNSRQIVRSTIDKQNSLRSRGVVKGLVASADNIRPVRSSRSRSLRKSADDLGKDYNSSVDDSPEGPVYENIQRKKLDRKDQLKPRDSGTIKMILTKHGIQIISDKETAL